MMSNIPSPCGSEEILKKFLKKLIKAELYEDSIGNIVVHKPGSGKKVMIICGIDEDSLVAISQNEDKIFFNHLGKKKLYPGTLISLNGSEGYICAGNDEKPSENQYIKMITKDEIDLGISGVVASEYFEDDNYIKGSRIGRLCVINEMVNLANNYSGELDLYIVFEVQSLFNHKGALVASNLIAPDFVLCFQEIESAENDLFLIKASKGHIHSNVEEYILKYTDFKSYADTELVTTATFIKNSVVTVVGIPEKFTDYSSSYISMDVKAKIESLFKNIN